MQIIERRYYFYKNCPILIFFSKYVVERTLSHSNGECGHFFLIKGVIEILSSVSASPNKIVSTDEIQSKNCKEKNPTDRY